MIAKLEMTLRKAQQNENQTQIPYEHSEVHQTMNQQQQNHGLRTDISLSHREA